MPTLFKRSNGIYYALLKGANGERQWKSTGEKQKSLALTKLISNNSAAIHLTPSISLKTFIEEI